MENPDSRVGVHVYGDAPSHRSRPRAAGYDEWAMARQPSVRLTFEDFLHFPDDGRRWELIDGEAFVTAAPKTRHQRVVLWLVRRIADHLEAHAGGEVFVAPYDVKFGTHDVVEPDIVFVADRDAAIIRPERIEGVPTWIMEVLSDPHRDRQIKRQQYERFGVPEYWIVDSDADTVEVYVLREGHYPDPAVHRSPDTIEPASIPNLRIDLAALLARPR